MPRPIAAAFDQGQVPTIACIDQTSGQFGTRVTPTLAALVVALQKFLDTCFVPVWGTPAKLVVADKFLPKAWAIQFIDTADVEGALGYHDLTPQGLPLSKVFVKTTIADGQKVSVTACHELCEMLIDPAINLCAEGPRSVMYAYEMCDACEEEEFPINGIPMSDFVYPAYFEGFRKPKSAKFDYLSKITRPFQILKGGYMPVFKNGQWSQIFGSKAKEKRFAKEDRRGHRSTIRLQKSVLPEVVASAAGTILA